MWEPRRLTSCLPKWGGAPSCCSHISCLINTEIHVGTNLVSVLAGLEFKCPLYVGTPNAPVSWLVSCWCLFCIYTVLRQVLSVKVSDMHEDQVQYPWAGPDATSSCQLHTRLVIIVLSTSSPLHFTHEGFAVKYWGIFYFILFKM
jgi:hypothetical protein